MRFLTAAIAALLLVGCSKDHSIFPIQIGKKAFANAKARDPLDADFYAKVEANKQLAEQREREAKQYQFEQSHPFVTLPKPDLSRVPSALIPLTAAVSRINFITRYPEARTDTNTFIRVGDSFINNERFFYSIDADLKRCERVNAFNGDPAQVNCTLATARNVTAFAKMLNDASIPSYLKTDALDEAISAATGREIDFLYLVRVAGMANTLCRKKGYRGVVPLITIAVPCAGRGSNLSISVADRMGLID